MDNFSININNLIYMAIDIVNGNLNFHFLIRLLEAIVRRLDLDQYVIDFTGPDAIRAQEVYTGCPDSAEIPLSSKFTLKRQSKSDDQFDNILTDTSNENLEEIDTTKIILKQSKKRATIRTEVDMIQNDGSLNLKVLKQIEKMMFGKRFISDNNYIGLKNNKADIKTSTSITAKEEFKTFPLVLNDVHSINKTATQVLTADSSIETERTQYTSMKSLKNNDSQKRVRVVSSPPVIFKPEELPLSESKIQVNDDDCTTYQSSQSIDSSEDNDSNILSSYINFRRSYSGTEKYILKNHEPIMLMKHIEKLLGRLNNVEHVIQILMDHSINSENYKKESNIHKSYSNINSNSDSEDDDLVLNISENQSHNAINPESRIKLSSKANLTLFQKMFGITQKNRDLDSFLTVRNFRSFFDDYTKKFNNIYEVFKINTKQIEENSLNINNSIERKVNLEEYKNFKKNINTEFNQIKKNIKEYILRDPEAAGLVHFIKGVSCVSCAKPAMMRTIHTPLKHPTKGVLQPRPNMKAHLTYELDRVRKQYNRIPGSKDLNLLENLCKCITPTRKCITNKTTKITQAQPVPVNQIVRTSPLQRWIKSKSALETKTDCTL